jgi:hypothetical protein
MKRNYILLILCILQVVELNAMEKAESSIVLYEKYKQPLAILVRLSSEKGGRSKIKMMLTLKLHAAAGFGTTQLCRKLIKANTDLVKSKDNSGLPPVTYAAAFGVPEMIRFFYQDLKAHNCTLLPTLIASVLTEKKDNIKYLLELGEDINEQSSQGETPLTTAVKGQSTAMLRFLLEQHADVEKKSALGKPLERAIQAQYAEGVQLLLTHGAHIDLPTCTTVGATGLAWKSTLEILGLIREGLNRDTDLLTKLKKDCPICKKGLTPSQEILLEEVQVEDLAWSQLSFEDLNVDSVNWPQLIITQCGHVILHRTCAPSQFKDTDYCPCKTLKATISKKISQVRAKFPQDTKE